MQNGTAYNEIHNQVVGDCSYCYLRNPILYGKDTREKLDNSAKLQILYCKVRILEW